MKIGILGGGQLGKMLYTAATKLGVDIRYMDSMAEGPVSQVVKKYQLGDITDYQEVLDFGQHCDVLSIEIEKVNTEALSMLDANGVRVYPQADVINCIQDKGLQKQFYEANQLPSSAYKLYDNIEELTSDLQDGVWEFPFVQKLRRDGYDGRGVQIIRSEEDLGKAFTAPFIIEELVDIHKELGVVTCRDPAGNIAIYDPGEMVFHPEANILLYQLSPARISEEIATRAKEVAKATCEAYGVIGLLAIEMFLTKSGDILINEVAPRPHNSGHHTIEATFCSQYENQIRVLSGMPMGSPQTILPSLLMNVLGDEGYTGPVVYEGLPQVLSIPGVNVHLYGKTMTKPFRKMGHINIVGRDFESLIDKYELIHRTLSVISQ